MNVVLCQVYFLHALIKCAIIILLKDGNKNKMRGKVISSSTFCMHCMNLCKCETCRKSESNKTEMGK